MSTDHDRITDSAATHLRGSRPALMRKADIRNPLRDLSVGAFNSH